ncbi:fructose bisphosphate aldolase [Celerinatantimonas yamalensis]|uniref:fructose-bisphosphate aldolase n=1 Tax=Celerinatantimonas yamalensis TaxID=559956 RepID=A0ABW9G5L2_9GAMM
MDSQKLDQATHGQGFIAALDQSGGSTPKALKGYGIDESVYTQDGVHDKAKMFELVHAMRTRVITSKEFDTSKIMGAILFEDTMDRSIDGLGSAEYLWQRKHIVPFLKCDKGLAEPESGVRLMKPIADLDATLERAVSHGVFGTKMRSVIDSYDPAGIRAIVDQQFDIAMQIARHGLVPILEPECTITAPDRDHSEKLLAEEFKRHLAQLDPAVRIMVKVSIPIDPHCYDGLRDDSHVVRVVALSGGYSRDEANEKLTSCPGLIASFSRALLQDLRAQQDDIEFDGLLKAAIDSIYQASIHKTC